MARSRSLAELLEENRASNMAGNSTSTNFSSDQLIPEKLDIKPPAVSGGETGEVVKKKVLGLLGIL